MAVALSGRRNGQLALAVPALAWYALFMVGPVLAIAVISLLDWPGMLHPPGFAGLGNFAAVLTDPVFWTAAGNSAVQLVVAVPVMIVGAYLLGFYVAQRPRGHSVLRYLLFIPGLISVAAKAMLAYAVFAPDGLLNGGLAAFGVAGTAWLADPDTALGCLIALDIWAGIGFTAVLIAARLDALPGEVAEAARLDGAGSWRLAWRIHFPMIRDFVGVVAMLQFLWTLFGSAQNVLLLTQGGPGTATTTLSYLVYSRAFVDGDLGYSQAVGLVLFVVGLVGMLAIRRALSAR
jgi:multiple sugar transport system permease protein